MSIWIFLVLFVWTSACKAQEDAFPVVPGDLRAAHGMVVSAQYDASEAGLEILRKGGNAVDASVATGFALAVTFPVAGNLGGGGFMVIRFADGKTTTIDYRETAPGGASRDMFLDSTGTFDPMLSQRGYLASGVPGSVAGLVLVHEKYGRLPLREVMAPAIRLAEQGYLLSYRAARTLNSYRSEFSRFGGTRRYFMRADGREYRAGERFVQKDLARVLRRIARDGRDGFYRGETADLIVAEMKRGKGLITHEDLQRYQAVERPALMGRYRGYRIIAMGPPSSGGIGLIQLLNAVEPYRLGASGYGSSQSIHVMGEAMRRVYADRAHWLGDPGFVQMPIEGLLAPEYMRRRMASFNANRVTPSDSIEHGDPLASEHMETTHYSVVDNEGNAVSATTTINGIFGSMVVVDGAGFFLNNEMDDFAAQPGQPNLYGLVGSEANSIAPGKRMLSSMTPTIVEDSRGRLLMVLGTPGGSTIITTVFQVIVNVIEHGMDMQRAVAAPRFHHQWLPDELRAEPYAFPADVMQNLRQRGWNVVEASSVWGRADGILVEYDGSEAETDPSGVGRIEHQVRGRTYAGGADPRGEDVVLGY